MRRQLDLNLIHCCHVSGCMNRMHDSKMDRNCLVVMIVAKSNAPNSLMVNKMQSCPNVDAAERTMASDMAAGCFLTKAMASTMEESVMSQKEEMTALQKFTQSIWLYVSIWYPVKSLS